MACDEDDICLVEKILDILRKNNIEKHKAFLVTDEITELLSNSFIFKSTDINIDLGNLSVTSDNTPLNTLIAVGDKKEQFIHVTSIKWELNAKDELGKLTLELIGLGN